MKPGRLLKAVVIVGAIVGVLFFAGLIAAWFGIRA